MQTDMDDECMAKEKADTAAIGIKRYSVWDDEAQSSSSWGQWCKWADVKAEVERLKAELRESGTRMAKKHRASLEKLAR